jgi:hypothetical protein
MSFTVTSRANSNSAQSAVGLLTSASFTPTANSRLFVFACAECDGTLVTRNWQITDSLSLSWTKLDESTFAAWAGDTAYSYNVVCWYADIGASPASMTVTVDAQTGNAFHSLLAFDVTGYNTSSPFPQSSVDNGATVNPSSNSASGTLTLGSNATNGNLVVALFGSAADSGGGFTDPSSWSNLVEQNNSYTQIAIFYRTNFTSTGVTCSDLGNDVGAWGGIIFEMAIAGGASISIPVLYHQLQQQGIA